MMDLSSLFSLFVIIVGCFVAGFAVGRGWKQESRGQI